MARDSGTPRDTRALRQAWEARRGQFAADVTTQARGAPRLLWIGAGLAASALGIVGAFLPVLPTTPFLILAAACFARSSPRCYDLLLSHRVLGFAIYTWRETRTIPPRVKVVALALIAVSFSVSIGFFVPTLFGRVAMAVVGVAVSVWLLRVPTRPPEPRWPPPGG